MTQPFRFPNGQLAHNAQDLLQLCQQFPDDGTNYLVQEDLEKWLMYIGKDDIAECAAIARQAAALEDRQKLGEFLNKCHALTPSDQDKDIINASGNEKSSSLRSSGVEKQENSTPERNPAKKDLSNLANLSPSGEKPLLEQPDLGKTAAKETPAVKPQTPSSNVSSSSTSGDRKPSFFKVVARLIVNVLYRSQD